MKQAATRSGVGKTRFVSRPWSVVRCWNRRDERNCDGPSHRGSGKTQRTNPTVTHENAPNEPNGGPLSVVRCQWSVVRCRSRAARPTRSTNQRVRTNHHGSEKTQRTNPIGSRKCAERTQSWLTRMRRTKPIAADARAAKMRRTNPNPRAAARAAERDKTKPFLATRLSELVPCQRDRTTRVFCETNPIAKLGGCVGRPADHKMRRTNPPAEMRKRAERTQRELAENMTNEPSGPLSVVSCPSPIARLTRSRASVRPGWYGAAGTPKTRSAAGEWKSTRDRGMVGRIGIPTHSVFAYAGRLKAARAP